MIKFVQYAMSFTEYWRVWINSSWLFAKQSLHKSARKYSNVINYGTKLKYNYDNKLSLFIVIAVENHYMQKIRYQNLSECITKWYCVSCSDSLSSSPSSKECFYPNNILKMVVQFSFIIRILNNFTHKHKRSLLQQLKLHQNPFVVYLTVYFFYTSISPFGYKRSFFQI